MLKRTLAAGLNLALGLAAGLLLLEGVLRINASLLLRGVPLADAIDQPISLRTYIVRYSDGDTIFWRPDLVKPLTPDTDQVEAVVSLQTDEFGFRNPPPLPARVQVVVLGRSTSLGAQNGDPWPQRLAAQLGGYVLNLAEPSTGLAAQSLIWQQYGQSRHPRWLILEIAPRIDIGDILPPGPRLPGLFVPLVQGVARNLAGDRLLAPPLHPIYPLSIDGPHGRVSVTCCISYMDFLSLSPAEISGSRDWAAYRARLLSLASQVRASGTCVALLYATAKEEVYFASAPHPEQLAPVLKDVTPLRVGAQGYFEPAAGQRADPLQVQRNVLAGRDVLAHFAHDNGLTFIDPTPLFIKAFTAGNDPFMVYDSHWNDQGHALIAQLARQQLASSACE